MKFLADELELPSINTRWASTNNAPRAAPPSPRAVSSMAATQHQFYTTLPPNERKNRGGFAHFDSNVPRQQVKADRSRLSPTTSKASPTPKIDLRNATFYRKSPPKHKHKNTATAPPTFVATSPTPTRSPPKYQASPSGLPATGGDGSDGKSVFLTGVDPGGDQSNVFGALMPLLLRETKELIEAQEAESKARKVSELVLKEPNPWEDVFLSRHLDKNAKIDDLTHEKLTLKNYIAYKSKEMEEVCVKDVDATVGTMKGIRNNLAQEAMFHFVSVEGEEVRKTGFERMHRMNNELGCIIDAGVAITTEADNWPEHLKFRTSSQGRRPSGDETQQHKRTPGKSRPSSRMWSPTKEFNSRMPSPAHVRFGTACPF